MDEHVGILGESHDVVAFAGVTENATDGRRVEPISEKGTQGRAAPDRGPTTPRLVTEDLDRFNRGAASAGGFGGRVSRGSGRSSRCMILRCVAATGARETDRVGKGGSPVEHADMMLYARDASGDRRTREGRASFVGVGSGRSASGGNTGMEGQQAGRSVDPGRATPDDEVGEVDDVVGVERVTNAATAPGELPPEAGFIVRRPATNGVTPPRRHEIHGVRRPGRSNPQGLPGGWSHRASGRRDWSVGAREAATGQMSRQSGKGAERAIGRRRASAPDNRSGRSLWAAESGPSVSDRGTP